MKTLRPHPHLALLATLLMATPALPQTTGRTLGVVYAYDLASTSYIYPTMTSVRGDFWSQEAGTARVTTSGSSTTVTAVSGSPFTPLAAGDEITFNLDGIIYKRYVVTRTSGTSIVISAAINLGDGVNGTTGYGFTWRRLATGTAATDSWFAVRNADPLTVEVNLTTITATSIDVKIECRLEGAVLGAATVWTKNYTAAGDDVITVSNHNYSSCRVGAKVNTDTGTQSLSITVSN